MAEGPEQLSAGPRPSRTKGVRHLVPAAATPYLVWVLVFFVTPTLILLASSFWTQTGVHIDHTLTLANYQRVFSRDSLELRILGRSLVLALGTCVLALVVAFPFAYFVAKVVKEPRHKGLLLLPVFLPFLISPLVVAVAWRGVLGRNGLVNSSLVSIGIIDQPLGFLLFSRFAVVLALIYSYSLWMFFTLYLSLETLDDDFIAAARDLGATRWQVFRFIVLPLALPGIATGAVLTFVPVIGAVLEPELLGGTGGRLIGNSIRGWFLEGLDWPLGAALGVMLMFTTFALLTVAFLAFARRFTRLLPSW